MCRSSRSRPHFSYLSLTNFSLLTEPKLAHDLNLGPIGSAPLTVWLLGFPVP